MNELSQGSAAADALPPYHLINLDRSKAYSEVTGERHHDDPHYGVAYMQGMLPFNVNEMLIPPSDERREPWMGVDLENKPVKYHPLYTPKMREILTRKLDRIMRSYTSPQYDDVDPTERGPDTDLVNLTMWLKGTVEYGDRQIMDAVGTIYQKRMRDMKDVVDFLVFDKRIVHLSQVGPARMMYLKAA